MYPMYIYTTPETPETSSLTLPTLRTPPIWDYSVHLRLILLLRGNKRSLHGHASGPMHVSQHTQTVMTHEVKSIKTEIECPREGLLDWKKSEHAYKHKINYIWTL